MNYRFALFICLLCPSIYAYAVSPKLLSLHDAILLSLRYNPNIHNAEIQRIVDRYSLAAAHYAFQPQLKLSGQAQHLQSVTNHLKNESQNTTQLNPQATLTTALGTQFTLALNNPVSNSHYQPSASLDITQPLLRGSKRVVVLQNLYNAMDAERVNKLQLKNTIITSVNQVIQDYLTLVQNYQTLKVDQRSLQSAKDTVEKNKIRIKAGTMAPTENTRPLAEIPARKLSIARDKNNIQKDKRRLLDDIGLDPHTPLEIDQHFDYYPEQIPDLAHSLNQGLCSNINYQISRINLKATERSHLKAQDDERWQLDAFANVTRGGGNGLRTLQDGANHTETMGLNLNVPIGDVNLHSNTLSTQIQLQQTRTNLIEQKRQLLVDINNAISDLNTQKEQINLALQSKKLQTRTVSEAQKKASFGRASMFEVSTEQDNLTTSEQQVVDNKIAFLKAYANFDALLGTTLERWNITVIY